MADKKVMFKFGDGLKEVKVGNEVYLVHGDRRSGPPHEMFITRIGRKLIAVNREMDGGRWGESEYYLETGYLKSQHSHGTCLYSSKAAYEQSIEHQKVIEEVCSRFRGYNNRWLSYDKAVRIKAILEEENGT